MLPPKDEYTKYGRLLFFYLCFSSHKDRVEVGAVVSFVILTTAFFLFLSLEGAHKRDQLSAIAVFSF